MIFPPARLSKVGLDGNVGEFLADSKHANGQVFGPDGRLYANANSASQILAYDADGEATVIADGIRGNDIVVAHNGNIYVTDPPPNTTNVPSKIWLIRPMAKSKLWTPA